MMHETDATPEPVDLFRQETGSGDPLYILHGLLGAGGNWRTLSRNVFGERFETVTPDLRNHGRSPHSDEFSYPAMTADLVRLMDARGDDSARVIGHSMGGKTAMHLALTRPGRVDRLVVVDIAPRAYDGGHEHIFDALGAVNPSEYESRSDIDDALAEDIPDIAVRQFLLKNLERDGEIYRWKMNLPAIEAAYDRITVEIASDESFDGPTLFVAGGASNYVSESDMPRIRRLFPNAELATIDGAGHWVHAEAPDRFAEVVMDFLTA